MDTPVVKYLAAFWPRYYNTTVVITLSLCILKKLTYIIVYNKQTQSVITTNYSIFIKSTRPKRS